MEVSHETSNLRSQIVRSWKNYVRFSSLCFSTSVWAFGFVGCILSFTMVLFGNCVHIHHPLESNTGMALVVIRQAALLASWHKERCPRDWGMLTGICWHSKVKHKHVKKKDHTIARLGNRWVVVVQTLVNRNAHPAKFNMKAVLLGKVVQTPFLRFRSYFSITCFFLVKPL